MKQSEPIQKFIAYYRVSTTKQEDEGHGLEAQKIIVQSYLANNEAALVAEFTEVESGKKSDRPKLAEAIKLCKRHKATLIIAKLDRLARNVHFISGLMESRVDFLACDNPHANRLMVHMLAAFAEHEREMISQRTKEGIRASKASGVVWGKHASVLKERHQKAANQHATQVWPAVQELVSIIQERHGRLDVLALTNEMNAQNVPTAKGGNWHRQSVYRLLDRCNELGLYVA